MNYLSVCSGIEAATVAWHHMGWKPVGFSEIEKFPSQVLAHHYPDVTNFGDMTKYKEWKIDGTVGLLVGGTPCQSFSVAGLRKGLEDPRGNLALTYCGILDHFRPKWFVWENVPGVLSSNGGRDFGSFLGAVAELGYGFSYRVLDSQYFGVAQRRRRVFVVGHLGDWRPTAKVLFESDCLRRDIKKGREKRKETATSTTQCFAGNQPTEIAATLQTTCNDYSKADGFNIITNPISFDERNIQFFSNQNYKTVPTLTATDNKGAKAICYENHGTDSRIKEIKVSPTVTARWGTGGNNVPLTMGFNSNARPNEMKFLHEQSNTLTASQNSAIAFTTEQTPKFNNEQALTLTQSEHKHNQCVLHPIASSDKAGTLRANPDSGWRSNGTPVEGVAIQNMAVRRLTEVECERLQGFPDNYTNIRENCPSGARYKALGNSMAVPVMRWIGERINNYERL